MREHLICEALDKDVLPSPMRNSLRVAILLDLVVDRGGCDWNGLGSLSFGRRMFEIVRLVHLLCFNKRAMALGVAWRIRGAVRERATRGIARPRGSRCFY